MSAIKFSSVDNLNQNDLHLFQYVIGGIHGVSRDAWRTHPLGGRSGVASHSHAASLLASAHAMRFRGRQLLDHEGISCLLILLFIDDPKINTTR
jgi:hypothetical protein